MLICLFLAIDIFLAGWDIALRRGKSRVSDEVVENTVSLPCGTRTITKASPSFIRRSAPRITTVTAKNPMADEAGFIGKILGTGYVEDGNRFYKPGKEVELSDNSFIIKEQKKIASLSEARAWLSDNGFDLSGTVQTEYMGSYLFRTVYSGFELLQKRRHRDMRRGNGGRRRYAVIRRERGLEKRGDIDTSPAFCRAL